jgi:hypothetical protein
MKSGESKDLNNSTIAASPHKWVIGKKATVVSQADGYQSADGKRSA